MAIVLVNFGLSDEYQLLLDQRVLCGLGTMWAAEAAFLAGANPWRPARDLAEPLAQIRAEMAALVGQSQGATGALQATQAGNQLLALQSQQLSDLIAVISANGRADALTEAERATAAEQGRIQRERFLTPGSGYQPGNAQMFNGNN